MCEFSLFVCPRQKATVEIALYGALLEPSTERTSTRSTHTPGAVVSFARALMAVRTLPTKPQQQPKTSTTSRKAIPGDPQRFHCRFEVRGALVLVCPRKKDYCSGRDGHDGAEDRPPPTSRLNINTRMSTVDTYLRHLLLGLPARSPSRRLSRRHACCRRRRCRCRCWCCRRCPVRFRLFGARGGSFAHALRDKRYFRVKRLFWYSGEKLACRDDTFRTCGCK